MTGPTHPAAARRLSLILAACSAAAMLTAALVADRVGDSSRVVGSPAPVARTGSTLSQVATTAELFELWTSRGVHGRQLVHVSQFLHYVPADEELAIPEQSAFPIATFDLPQFWRRALGPRTVLWVAQQAGVVRGVYHVLPPAELDQRIAGLAAGAVGVTVTGRRIRTHDNGSWRFIVDALPALDEPVLLVVDASYLNTRSPDQLLSMLRDARLASDLFVLCRSTDNPDVEEQARQRLDELARALRRTP